MARDHELTLKVKSGWTAYAYYCLTAVRILREDGSEASRGELGRIVCKLPMAPGTMSTLFGADERFKKTYFEAFKV